MAIGLWAAGDGLARAASDFTLHQVALVIYYTGSIGAAGLAWLVALRFAEAQGLPFVWARSAIAWVPVMFFLATWVGMLTNPWTHVFVTPVVGDFNPRNGLWWVNAAGTWCVTGGVAALYAILRSRHRAWAARRKATIMLWAYILPVACNVIYIAGIWTPPVDATLPALAVSTLLVMIGIYRTGLFNALPVSRTALVDSEPSGMVLLDTDGHVLHANRAARALLPEVSWEFYEPILSELESCLLSFDGYEATLWSSDRNFADVESGIYRTARSPSRFVRVSGHPLISTSGDELGLALRFSDVTELIEAQRRVLEAHERFRALTEQSSDVIFEIDADGRFAWVSPSVRTVLGFDPKQVIGRSPENFMHPDDRKERLAEGDELPGMGDRRLRFQSREGSWRWLETSTSPYQTANGEQHVLCTARDVTERRQRDEELRRSQKLESLGVLAGGVAHDFNNLLTAMLGHTEIALQHVEDSSRAHTSLTEVRDAVLQAADLTTALLAYTANRPRRRQPFSVSALTRETVAALRPTFPSEARILVDLTEDEHVVQGDPAGFRQIAINLVTNALEAAAGVDGASVWVRTRVRQISSAEFEGARVGNELAAGLYAVLEVEDSGAGMSPETQERLFEPFFTTKFQGRGLGMASVHGIVRSGPYALWLRSRPGGGSCFRVALGVSQGRPVTGVRASDSPPWRASGTVLVVDDDYSICRVVAVAARSVGFDVLIAGSGREGIRLYESCPNSIVVSVIDLTMPDESGVEVFRELRRRFPDAKVLMMSGYIDDNVIDELQSEGLAGFLPKPFDRTRLIAALRRATTTDPGADTPRP